MIKLNGIACVSVVLMTETDIGHKTHLRSEVLVRKFLYMVNFVKFLSECNTINVILSLHYIKKKNDFMGRMLLRKTKNDLMM